MLRPAVGLGTRLFCPLKAGSRRRGLQRLRNRISASGVTATGEAKVGIFQANNSEDGWQEVDAKVNTYPTARVFKAVGSGGQPFADSMVRAVESVAGPVPDDKINLRLSSEQKYIAVTVGPVRMESGNQVIQVFRAMKADERLKWCL